MRDERMKITPLHDENGYRCLAVEADWSAIAADYDDIIAAYSRVQIPGFRSGKVPRSVIEQRLQKQVLEDLSRQAAQRLGREAVRESGTEPLGPIEISDIGCARGATFSFTARFRPMPEIEVPDLGSLAVRGERPDPKDQISHRLLELTHFEVPAEAVQAELGDDVGTADSSSAAWKEAQDRVRLILILKKIARQEGIEVDETDVERRIEEKAVEFGVSSPTLKAELEKGGGRQRLKDMLLAESTLNFLIERSGS